MEPLYPNEMPSNVKQLKGNYSITSWIEEMNKMSICDILKHHRSQIVFDLIKETYHRTKYAEELYTNLLKDVTKPLSI